LGTLFLFPMVLLAGCSTTVSYQARTPAGPPRPEGYPVLVYTENETVPRPCEVIGTVSIRAAGFTMFGGSIESEMKKVLQAAREKGADAVQLQTIKQPGFSNGNYRLTANLLRYADAWEAIAITERQFADFLAANQRTSDPIEGVWTGEEGAPLRVGIMRNTSKPGRDFIGFILNTEDPAWHKGYKKMEIRRGPKPGSYVMAYYLDDFSKRETTFNLGRNLTFSVAVPTENEDTAIISYSKNRQIP